MLGVTLWHIVHLQTMTCGPITEQWFGWFGHQTCWLPSMGIPVPVPH
jgi:hypothetical protein